MGEPGEKEATRREMSPNIRFAKVIWKGPTLSRARGVSQRFLEFQQGIGFA